MSRSGRAETRSRTKDDVRKVMAAVDKVLYLKYQLNTQVFYQLVRLKNLVKNIKNYIIRFRYGIGKNDGSKLPTPPWKFINGYPLTEKDT